MAQCVLMPEAYRDPRRVGRKAEHVVARLFIDAGCRILNRAAGLDLVEHVADPGRLAFIVRCWWVKEAANHSFGRLRLRPKHSRGVGDLDAVAAAWA